MAQQADGTVYINSSIDTDGFTAGGKEIEAAARRAAKTVKGIGDAARIALEKQTAAFVKSNQLYAQQEQKVQDLQNKLEEMAGQTVETTAFKEIQKQIDTDTAKLNRLIQTQEEFLATGGKESSTAYQRRQMQIEELRNSIEYAKAEQDELLQSGQAYQPVDTSAVTDKLIAEQQRLQQMGSALNISYDALRNKIEQYGGSIAGAAQKHGLLRKALSSVAGAAKKAGAAILTLHKNTKKSNGSMGSGIKNILKYTLGISSLLALFKKIKSAVKEGMENLAQYSGETNTHLSALKSSMTQLKNSLATAFAPILTVITPILTKFINLLSQAITYVGMFFAALTGANSFTKAVAVQEDYAASLGETADNAKEAKKYLSGLDEIRTYSEDKNASGGGAGGVSPADMFETVPIESKIKEFADKVKQILLEMFAPLREAWNKYGESIMETLGKIKDSYLAYWSRIANVTINWFRNLNWDPLLASVDNLLKKLHPLIDLILNGLAWAYENVLLPFGKWTIEKALPVILDDLGKAFEFVTAVIERLNPVFTWLWENVLKPFGETVGEVVIDVLTAFGGLLDFLTGVFSGDWEKAFQGLQIIGESLKDAIFSIFRFIQNVLNSFDEFLQGVFAKDWSESFGVLGNIINGFFDALEIYWNLIKGVFEGIIQFITGVFTGDWNAAWDGIVSIFKSVWNEIVGIIKFSINSVIGFINGMISGIIAGINTMINALNSLHIDVPDWIPGFGGKSIGFSIPTITAPQIPYLASGAVIPPNAPFLAVLGDQKRGTNVEAPLSMIEEAVRKGMSQNNQGFNGTIELKVFLTGKQIYDEVIKQGKLKQTITGKNDFMLSKG